MRAQREHKLLVTSDGAEIEQELVETGAGIDAFAVGDGVFQIRSYPSAHSGSSAQAGWEYVEGLGSSARRRASPSRRLRCSAPTSARRRRRRSSSTRSRWSSRCTSRSGTRSSSTASTAAKPRMRARAFKPSDLGSLRYGSEQMNVTADATTPGGLGTFGFDDEGVPARREPIVVEGVLRGFLTSRETAERIGSGAGGSMRADSWNRMPLIRMTNLHLEPGEGSFEDLLADVDDGVYLETNKSWSIDDKRLNFQFGTQIAGDQERQARADVPRRDLHRDHARVLGLARRRRGAGGLAHAGSDELRQGSAGAGRTRVARRVPVPLPQRPGRRQGMKAPAMDVQEVAADALRAADGDEAEALVLRERSGLARFASSEVHQPTLIENCVVTPGSSATGRSGRR